MFPGFFLAFLYLLYIIGWALLNPKVAPKLPESENRVPVPDWTLKLRDAYGSRIFLALCKALMSPAKAASILRDGRVVGYGDLLRATAYALVPLTLVSVTLSTVWWYVVIHQQADAIDVFAGVEQLGTPDLVSTEPTDAEKGPGASFYWWYAGIAAASVLLMLRYYLRMSVERLEVIRLLTDSVAPLGILTVLVLAVILFGITTATESAAVGAAGAFLLAFHAKSLNWKRTKEAVFLTAKTTSMVCWLFVGSAIFSAVFALLGGQALLESWVLSLNLTPMEFMILSMVIIFILGWPLEWTEIIVIFVPIFLPMLKHFDIDPILWGVMVFVNLQAAFLSPPVAMSAFYLKGVAPAHVTINQIFAGMMPYMLVVIMCMVLLYIWPGLTLWLPGYLYN
jgi:TRAP-type mannitol/chloroaromatic compound transport system permease large subunit